MPWQQAWKGKGALCVAQLKLLLQAMRRYSICHDPTCGYDLDTFFFSLPFPHLLEPLSLTHSDYHDEQGG
jgi:hypothetical protein